MSKSKSVLSDKTVKNFKCKGYYVRYFGKKSIKIAFSKDKKFWHVFKKPIFTLSKGKRKKHHLKIKKAEVNNQGILVTIHIYSNKDPSKYKTKKFLFNKQNPCQILKQKKKPTHKPSPSLKKYSKNPILKPILKHFWESKAVFNPAVLYDKNQIHLLYRAIGRKDVSVIGYASSIDGLHIESRLTKPVFTPKKRFEGNKNMPKKGYYSPFTSGGGCYGGCEDPRLTRIGNRIYMTYVAYDGWSPPRVALTSINRKDFLSHNWNWKDPVLISKPGVVDKNAAILPQKVNNMFVIFHRIYPNILIDYVSSLNFDGKKFLKGEYKIRPRKNCWDSRKVGIGPTPLKTKEGWLAIYHAVDNKEDNKYKMGAMLLQHNNPTKVLARTNQPILEPTKSYENNGFKFGVAYPCGAAIMKKRLFVYYGGSDTYTCVATAPVNKFLKELRQNKQPKLSLSQQQLKYKHD